MVQLKEFTRQHAMESDTMTGQNFIKSWASSSGNKDALQTDLDWKLLWKKNQSQKEVEKPRYQMRIC